MLRSISTILQDESLETERDSCEDFGRFLAKDEPENTDNIMLILEKKISGTYY